LKKTFNIPGITIVILTGIVVMGMLVFFTFNLNIARAAPGLYSMRSDISSRQTFDLVNKIVAFDYYYYGYRNQPELIFKFKEDENIVLLTFDAGSSTGYYREVLSTLKEHGIHATFFVTGKWAENNMEAVTEIFDNGSDIANHSYSHSNFVDSNLDTEDIKSQIERTESIVESGNDITQLHFFRFPYGSYTKDMIQSVAKIGYIPFQWTIDSLGWTGNLTPAGVKDRVIANISPGSIIMFHIGSQQDSQALGPILEPIEDMNYGILSISEYLEYLYD